MHNRAVCFFLRQVMEFFDFISWESEISSTSETQVSILIWMLGRRLSCVAVVGPCFIVRVFFRVSSSDICV